MQLMRFLIKNKNFLLFLFLFGISLFFTLQSHSYQRSKIISSTNFVTGNIYNWANEIDQYFHLTTINKRLKNENKKLHNRVEYLKQFKPDSILKDSGKFTPPFRFYTAEVIANRYSHRDNYLLINAGKSDSIAAGQGVITSEGVIGIVESTTENYARVISILNSQLSISARLKDSNHFGSITWNGKSPNIVQLKAIPRLAPVSKGDTIVTNGRSFIFPGGIPIGVVKDFHRGKNDNYYHINIKLFNDMTSIGFVYIIENNNQEELKEITQPDGK